MEKIKALQVNTFENKGGAARLVQLLNEGFNRANYSSKIQSGENVLSDQTFTDKVLSLLELYEFFGNNSGFSYSNFDIINFHNLHGNYFKLNNLVKISQDKPVVISLHDKWMLNGSYPYEPNLELSKFQRSVLAPFENTFYPLYRKFMEPSLLKFKSDIYRKSNFSLVTSSNWMKNEIEKSILRDKKISVIPYGIKEEIFQPLDKTKVREKLNLPKNKFIICFSASGGTTNKRKGFMFAKKIIELLENENITFLLLGDKNWNMPNAINVEFIKDDTLLNEYYNASDIYLFTSIIDNSPLTLLESLSSGLPVAALNSGGVGEILKNGKNGFLVDNFDIEALAGLILTYQKDVKIQKRFRLEAREAILEKFTQKRMVKDYINFYQATIHDFKK